MRERRVQKKGAARRGATATWAGLCEAGGRWKAGGGRTRLGDHCETGGHCEAGGRWTQVGGGARARARGGPWRRGPRSRGRKGVGVRARRARERRALGARARGCEGGTEGCQIRDPDILVHCRCKKTWREMWRPVMAEVRASPTRVLPVLNA